MLEEGVADKEQILILSWKSAFVNDEVTFFMTGFVEVLFWGNLEYVVAHLEADWFQLWSDVLAAIFHVTESLIGCAIEFWEGLLPLFSDILENIWWNRKLRRASVNNSWVRSVFAWLLHWLSSVEHALSLKSPGTKPVLKVLECF